MGSRLRSPGQAGRRGGIAEIDVVVLFGNGGRARDPAAPAAGLELSGAGLRRAKRSRLL